MATTAATGDSSSLHLSANGAFGTVLKNRAQTFAFGPEEFRITKHGFLVHDLELWTGDALLASARRGTFSYSGSVWNLRFTKCWSEIEYTLYQDKNPIGRIRSARSWLSRLFGLSGLDFREIVIDLPEKFPVAVQLFLTWVACYLWTFVDGVSGD